jgi:hypothetical protein
MLFILHDKESNVTLVTLVTGNATFTEWACGGDSEPNVTLVTLVTV